MRLGRRMTCSASSPAAAIGVLLALLAAPAADGQHRSSGFAATPVERGVSPVFEGWYRNPDGTYSLLFGYYSRSAEEVLDIPLGPDNFMVPAIFDGRQPTRFMPRPQDRGPGRGIRHWGVFAVTVPADFGDREVVWTLRVLGDMASVPGHLRNPGYELNPFRVESTGESPPLVRLRPADTGVRGPGAAVVAHRTVAVGSTLELTAWAAGSTAGPITLRWFQHQGPGEARFEPRQLRVDQALGYATTNATFDSPGRYLLRLRATSEATEFDRFCCWTNGLVEVTVTGQARLRQSGETANAEDRRARNGPDRSGSTTAAPPVLSPPRPPVRVRPPALPAGRPRGAPPTYARNVAPILQARCQQCHRSGSVAPMALTTYAEVRPWANLIRDRVEARLMPPWHLDPSAGTRKFQDNPSLTEEEIATIVRWAEAGAPEGDPDDLPAPATWADRDAWTLSRDLGAPDLVVGSGSSAVPARGPDRWWMPIVDTGLARRKWIRAIEVRPAHPLSLSVVHHAVLFLHDGPQTTLLAEWAIGKGGETMPTGTGRRIPAGARIGWDIHFVPAGREVPEAAVEVGLWFYPEGDEPAFESRLETFRVEGGDRSARGAHLDLPPGATRLLRSTHLLTSDARIESFQPHMHLRGAGMSMEAVYPDGRREMLASVDRFRHGWQINYRFAEASMPLLPRGTSLVFTARHDNSAGHPGNPDPRQWVGFGRRTVDEMAHAWVSITRLTPAQYESLRARQGGDGSAP